MTNNNVNKKDKNKEEKTKKKIEKNKMNLLNVFNCKVNIVFTFKWICLCVVANEVSLNAEEIIS